MKSEELIEALFLADTKNHQIEIRRDDGIYRHIKVRSPGTIHYGFDIITWPGWLCYTGDMGSYTFQRLEDMFEFFRRKVPGADPGHLEINTGYWGEKVQAEDRNGRVREFDADKFRSRLKEILTHRGADNALLEAVQEEVLDAFSERDEREARELADGFRFEGKVVFSDLWDYDFKGPSYHFVWCCYALAWTIREYDKQKAGA
jgi:hypothetical protein